ncbi:hypothetical protein [Leucobacter luti]|uniref:hypothetical protein n=1 Tax=Leucobacter luti TaxID=340320 RepID=UPI003D004F4D
MTSDEVVFIADRTSIRALLDSIRETHEELRDGSFLSRIGISAEQAVELRIPIREFYRASACDASSTRDSAEVPRLGFHRIFRSESAENERGELKLGASLQAGTLVFAASREEIAAHIEMCAATMEVLDDWDYSIRMGFTREEIQVIIDELRQLI